MLGLFTMHNLSLQTAFSDLKRQAGEQPFSFVGTPGSVTARVVNGRSFYYRQYYDPNDKKAADYLGPVGEPAADARATAMRGHIELANVLLGVARLLSRAGYVRVDARTDAILSALANNGLFRAGAVLVGSHAYGSLLNELGARAAGYATEDIDVARDRPLGLARAKSFEQMLADSKLGLHPVPQLDRKKPPTSFKAPGADRTRVDLLVPVGGTVIKVVEAKDLHAHATGLPYFRYLLKEPLETIVLGRSAVVPVNVPRPERLAWHKMLVSALRNRSSDKKAKDLEQAAVLVAALAEREPSALEEAFHGLPASARKMTKVAAKTLLARLQEGPHERAVDVLRDVLR